MATAVGPNIVTDGLIYAIDAGSTRSYPGSGATVDDLVGATSGSLINGVTYSSNNAGKWQFDGVDQSLNIDLIELGNFTISQFIKFPTSSARMSIGGGNNGLGGTFRGYIWYRSNVSPQEIRVTVDQEQSGGVFQVPGSTYLDGWSEITATRTGSTYKLYVNGVQVDITRTGSTNQFSIRTIGWSYSNGYAFDGDISNTLIYNAALTDAQVLQNFNAQKSRFPN